MYILNHFEIILYQSAIKLTQDKLCSINKDIQFTRDFQMLIGPSCMVLNLGNDKGETKFKQARYVVFANYYTFSGQIPYRMKELYLTSPIQKRCCWYDTFVKYTRHLSQLVALREKERKSKGDIYSEDISRKKEGMTTGYTIDQHGSLWWRSGFIFWPARRGLRFSAPCTYRGCSFNSESLLVFQYRIVSVN